MNDKINRAIQLLRDNEPKDGKGYGLAFSGGKDSIVIKQLAIEAGVKFTAFYSVTTIDPPELVRYIRTYHKDVEWLRNGSFFARMRKYGLPPTRWTRWCCAEFKEQSLREYSAKIIGVRGAESPARKARWREVVKDRLTKDSIIICPIVDWEDIDVWDFIKARKLPYCELYDEGFKRLGCIGCPLAGAKNAKRDFARWPNFKKAFINTFVKMHKDFAGKFTKRGRVTFATKFKSGEQWFDYWVSGMTYPQYMQETCQMELMFIGADEATESEVQNG